MENIYNYSDSESVRGLNAKVYSVHHMYEQKVVFTNGCFDLLHVGHVRYLNEAKKQGDLLIVGLNSDASVKALKGEDRPIQSQEDRAEILLALSAVDYVCIFNEDTPLNLIKNIKPDILVKGGDWTVEQIVGGKEVLENGGEVKSLQFVDGKSTTKIIERSKS
ncbi:MAG: D-glycero-beta-D-manno-heptose 1-phosphate adenylyltransferase [Bdellovibrionaceae bacterium]|jgi:D-glycero-beta-D-manno-heptose 1-phosphate adenylyltransferase|nr:D-glycero-beta-D-manno-heptose 1-phosphate adenylyltransferase [Pseudobdellovibrionaceae bacterium]